MQVKGRRLRSASLQECCLSSPRESYPTLSWPSALTAQESVITSAPTCWTTTKWRPAMAFWLMPRRTRRSSERPILTSTVCRSGVPAPYDSTETSTWKPVYGSLSATMTCRSSWQTAGAPLGQMARYIFQHLSLAPWTNRLLGSVRSFFSLNYRFSIGSLWSERDSGWDAIQICHTILIYKRCTKPSGHTIKRPLLK